jgi:endonuclease V-like protein UPF0215 family
MCKVGGMDSNDGLERAVRKTKEVTMKIITLLMY